MAILTVDELREHVNTGLGDDALQRLLDASEYLIVERAGPAGARTEIAGGGYRFVTVSRPIGSIGSIKEVVGDSELTLAADDYLVRYGDLVVERLQYGTNSRSTWDRRVEVTYTPEDDAALRADVQIDLIRAGLSYNPGLTGEQLGAWSAQYAANSVWNNAAERESILSRLDPEPSMVIV